MFGEIEGASRFKNAPFSNAPLTASFLAINGTIKPRRSCTTVHMPTTKKTNMTMGKRRSPLAPSAEPIQVWGVYEGVNPPKPPPGNPPNPPKSGGGTSPSGGGLNESF